MKPLKLLLSFFIFLHTNGAFAQITDSGFIDVDGSKLRYVVYGKGKPCLVIGSSVYYPRTFSKEIYNSLKMYFVDLKWFAPEYVQENLDSVNINSIVHDVEEVRKKLGLLKPLIMGHSIHGSIAAEYAKQHSDKISGLVMIGAPCNRTIAKGRYDSAWNISATAERKKIMDENARKLNALDSQKVSFFDAFVASYNATAPKIAYDPHYDFTPLWDGVTIQQELISYLFDRVFRKYNMFSPATLIPVPVFVAVGQYDFDILLMWKETTPTGMPNYSFKLFEKSGHTPQMEEPDEFNKLLIEWVKTKVQN